MHTWGRGITEEIAKAKTVTLLFYFFLIPTNPLTFKYFYKGGLQL